MKKVFIIVLILILVGAFVYYLSDTQSDIQSYTFTAKVDGVPFDVSRAHAKHAAGWLDITAVDGHSGEGKIKIIMFHLYCSWTGSIILNSDSPNFGSGAAYGFGNKESSTLFETNSSYTGQVTISALDLNAKKVSGTFEYRAIQDQHPGSQAVKVTGFFKDIPIN